ncbi:hypothetical protein Esti_006308 [Eimeria stiedai]
MAGASFLGTPLSGLSLEELEEQVEREQPWLRRGGGASSGGSGTRLPAKLLLAAAARAAKSECRRCSEAAVKAGRASKAARAAARKLASEALDAQDAAAADPADASLAAAAAAAQAAAQRAGAAAATAAHTHRHSARRAALAQQAAASFWEREADPASPLSRDQFQLRIQRSNNREAAASRCRFSINPDAHDSEDEFVCANFQSSRKSRAAPRASRPEDFMDEQDFQFAAAAAKGFNMCAGWALVSLRSLQSGVVPKEGQQRPAWSRLAGEEAEAPSLVFMGGGEAAFASQPQWRMHSLRRNAWVRRMQAAAGLSGTSKDEATQQQQQQQHKQQRQQAERKIGGLSAVRGPQLPAHVEALRQGLLVRAGGEKGDVEGQEGEEQGGSLEAFEAQLGGGSTVTSALAAEAAAAAAEAQLEAWSEQAAAELLRLQPQKPTTLGLGFHGDSLGSSPPAPAASGSSSSGRRLEGGEEGRGYAIEVEPEEPRRGLRNYNDDEEEEDLIYGSTAFSAPLYDFTSSSSSRKHVRPGAETEALLLQLRAEAEAEGAVVVPPEEARSVLLLASGDETGEDDPSDEACLSPAHVLDLRELGLDTHCALPLPVGPEGFDGIHVSTEEEETGSFSGWGGETAFGALAQAADTAERAHARMHAGLGGFTQAEAKTSRGVGLTSATLGLLGRDHPPPAADAAAAARESRPRRPLWGCMPQSIRTSLLSQVGGREVQWVKEGDEAAAAAAASQPLWLQQHQQQLLRRNQLARLEQQALQMRHRLNCLLLPFASDPETQQRFDAYRQLRRHDPQHDPSSAPHFANAAAAADAEGKGLASLLRSKTDAAAATRAAATAATPAAAAAAATGTLAAAAAAGAAAATDTAAAAGAGVAAAAEAGDSSSVREASSNTKRQHMLAPQSSTREGASTCEDEDSPSSSSSSSSSSPSVAAALAAVALINAGLPPAALMASAEVKAEDVGLLILSTRLFRGQERGGCPQTSREGGALSVCRGPAEAAVFAAAYARVVEQRQELHAQEATLKNLRKDSLARLGITTRHNAATEETQLEVLRLLREQQRKTPAPAAASSAASAGGGCRQPAVSVVRLLDAAETAESADGEDLDFELRRRALLRVNACVSSQTIFELGDSDEEAL